MSVLLYIVVYVDTDSQEPRRVTVTMHPDIPLTAISLFSGAGGMDVGFQRAGFDIQFANDIDRDACETYRANHGDIITQGDLKSFLPDLAAHQDIDMVFGGPPCQGFSVAGKMNPNDERSKLLSTYMDVVETVRPKAFVCENVKALATLTRWQEVRDTLVQRAEQNYHVVLMVLNSRFFGVPQGRERMFLVGFRKDLFDTRTANVGEAFSASLDTLAQRPPSLKQIITKLGKAGSKSNPRQCRAKITYAKSPVMRRSPYAGMLFNGAGRPLPAEGHSSTLPASMGGNKTPIIDELEIFEGAESFVEQYHKHLTEGGSTYKGEAPKRLRRLTVDECLAIQTFPDNYKLEGSHSSMYRQIGNAVPCHLAEAVARVSAHMLQNGICSMNADIKTENLQAAE